MIIEPCNWCSGTGRNECDNTCEFCNGYRWVSEPDDDRWPDEADDEGDQ